MNTGELLRLLKPYLNYAKYNDEKFLNEILKCIVKTGNVLMRNGEPFYFDKSYTSKIINNHACIPPAILETAIDKNLLCEIFHEFTLFYESRIKQVKAEELRVDLINALDTDTAFTTSEKDELLSISDNKLFLFTLLMKTLFIKNDTAITSGTVIWKKGNSYIQAVYGDIFKYAFSDRRKRKTIVVIPVNTRFDTHLSTKLENTVYPMISSETVHGEWLLRLEKQKGRIDDMHERIQSDLRCRGFACNDDGEYPIGTLAVVDIGNTCFYLLAISSFDKYNHAKSRPEFIEQAVTSLLDFYDINGQGYELYLPLLGTGRSRAGMSFQESFDLIKKEALHRTGAFHGKITIVISNDNKADIVLGGDNQ